MTARIGIAKRALDDARECGDACGYWELDGKLVLCVADGLGHGPEAEKAATAALDCIAANLGEPITGIFERCNVALFKTRGAAMSIAVIDKDTGSFSYGGIGNVLGVFGKAGETVLPNSGGIVGAGYNRLSVEKARLWPGDLVVMYTDGVKSDIALRRYDRAVIADAKRLAEMILHDWRRGTDDAAVLAFRYEAP